MPFGSIDDLGFFYRQPKCATRPAAVTHQKRTHGYLYLPGAKCGPPLTRVVTPEGEEAPPPEMNRLLELPTDLIRHRRKIIEIKSPGAPPGLIPVRRRRGIMHGYFERQRVARAMGIGNANDPRVRVVASVPDKWPSKKDLSVDVVMKYLEVFNNTYLKKYGKRALRTLLDIWWNPSAVELEDLQLLDYGLPFPRGGRVWGHSRRAQAIQQQAMKFVNAPTTTAALARTASYYTPKDLLICSPTPPTFRGRRYTYDVRQYYQAWRPSPAAYQPFFCPPPPEVEKKNAMPFPFPRPLNAGRYFRAFGPESRAKYWGIDLSEPWEKVKPVLMRVLVAEKALLNYPWPSPAAYFGNVWGEVQAGDFKKFVLNGPPKSWEDVRAFLALSILKHYNSIIGIIVRRQKKRAKKKKRRARIRAIASLAVGAVFAIAAPAAFTLAVSAIKTYADIKRRKKAAKSMVEASKQFARTDKAFAAELDRVGKRMDEQAAAEQEALPMSPGAADAEAEAVAEELIEKKGVVIVIEGQEAGTAETLETAGHVAKETAEPGDRVEFIVAGKPKGLWLRTKDNFEQVPKEAEAKIRAMPPDQLREIVMGADTPVPVVNYIAVGVPLAAAVFL